MKKVGIVLGVIVLVIIVIAIATCNGIGFRDSTFEIRVSGTEGLEFSGSYMVVTAEGQSTSKSVDGTVPEQYLVSGAIVSVVFQKQSQEGILRVEIVKGTEVIASEETTASYGVVSVATD